MRMRILFASLLAVAAATGVDVPASTPTNNTGPFGNAPTGAVLVPQNDAAAAESSLRGTTTQALEAAVAELHSSNILEDIPDAVDFARLSSSKRIQRVQELQTKLVEFLPRLTDAELLAAESGAPHFASIMRNTKRLLGENLQEPVDTVVRLLTEDLENEKQDTLDPRQEEEHAMVGTSNTEPKQEKNKTTSSKHQKTKSHFRRAFDEQRERVKSFHGHHFHHKMLDMQDAIFNGDFSTVNEFTNNVYESHRGRYGKKPSTPSDHRRLDKASLCEQLVDCASKMSKYDMFVYFYSDDIDPTTGEVDSNVFKYDEADLEAKFVEYFVEGY